MKAAAPVHGFSLVEIVLAMGIISFSIIAILGLLSVGLNSSRNALDESLLAAMSRQVVGSLRQQRFVNNDVFTNLAAGTTATVCFFDANGVRLLRDGKDLDQANALAAKAAYQCTVTGASDTERLGPSPAMQIVTPCLLDVTLTFQWPMEAKKANSYSLRTSIARYY